MATGVRPIRYWPIYLTFACNGLVLGNWIPRIPHAKALFGLSATEIGIALLFIAAGTLISFMVAGAVTRRLGLRRTCMLFMIVWAAGVGFAPFASGLYSLCGILLFAGMGVGMLEVAMNTAADGAAQRTGREIMSRCHGFWSLGSLIGALVASAVAAQEIGIRAHFSVMGPIVGTIGVIAAAYINEFAEETAKHLDGHPKSPFNLPNKAIFLLCMMPIGIMLVEGAFIDWSALFVETILDGGSASGLIYSAFAASVAGMRLVGDWITIHVGARRLVLWSSFLATIGIIGFSLAPTVEVAFVAALVSGLGVGNVYPLAMTAAARRPGNSEDNVAALSLFAFTAFMLAPPAIGFLTDLYDLRIGLLTIAPFALMSLILSGEVSKGTSNGSNN